MTLTDLSEPRVTRSPDMSKEVGLTEISITEGRSLRLEGGIRPPATSDAPVSTRRCLVLLKVNLFGASNQRYRAIKCGARHLAKSLEGNRPVSASAAFYLVRMNPLIGGSSTGLKDTVIVAR